MEKEQVTAVESNLKAENEFLKMEVQGYKDSLSLVLNICKERNFDLFPEDKISFLTKHPIQMNRDELIERNREISKKYKKSAKNPDSTPYPTFLEQHNRCEEFASDVNSSPTTHELIKFLTENDSKTGKVR